MPTTLYGPTGYRQKGKNVFNRNREAKIKRSREKEKGEKIFSLVVLVIDIIYCLLLCM
jgi:hypothetical protein